MKSHPRCMIVEDQVLIAMSLEAYLEEVGFDIIGPFSSNAQALARLETDLPGIALLDIMLADGPVVQLARALKSRGIPFAIYSGLRPAADSPPELRGAPWLEKPARREALSEILQQLTQDEAASSGPHNAPEPPWR